MKITLNGEFSELDIKNIFSLLREIEQKNPEKLYFASVEDENTKTIEEAKEKLLKVYPGMPIVPVDVSCLKMKNN